jgi:hypothetical protein
MSEKCHQNRKSDCRASTSSEVKTRRRQRAADTQRRDAVGSGVTARDYVVAGGDGLRQIGDGVHAEPWLSVQASRETHHSLLISFSERISQALKNAGANTVEASQG